MGRNIFQKLAGAASDVYESQRKIGAALIPIAGKAIGLNLTKEQVLKATEAPSKFGKSLAGKGKMALPSKEQVSQFDLTMVAGLGKQALQPLTDKVSSKTGGLINLASALPRPGENVRDFTRRTAKGFGGALTGFFNQVETAPNSNSDLSPFEQGAARERINKFVVYVVLGLVAGFAAWVAFFKKREALMFDPFDYIDEKTNSYYGDDLADRDFRKKSNMAYGNSYRSGGRYSSPRYSRGGFEANGYHREQRFNQGPPKKRTGAKRGIQKFGNVNKGKEYITGWRVSRGTLFTYYCYPYRGKNSKTHELYNKTTGEMIGYNWLCKVTNKRTHRSTVHSCLVNAQMTKAVIKDLELVINTNAPNGGYCGTYVRRKR